MADNKPKQKPSRSFYFNGISLSIFEREATNKNSGEIFTSRSVAISESYVDQKGVRQYTPFISFRNIPSVIAVCMMAVTAPVLQIEEKGDVAE